MLVLCDSLGEALASARGLEQQRRPTGEHVCGLERLRQHPRARSSQGTTIDVPNTNSRHSRIIGASDKLQLCTKQSSG